MQVMWYDVSNTLVWLSKGFMRNFRYLGQLWLTHVMRLYLTTWERKIMNFTWEMLIFSPLWKYYIAFHKRFWSVVTFSELWMYISDKSCENPSGSNSAKRPPHRVRLYQGFQRGLRQWRWEGMPKFTVGYCNIYLYMHVLPLKETNVCNIMRL